MGAIKPTTLEEALTSLQADQWKLAMEDKMRSLEQNETWTLTKLPAGRQPIQNLFAMIGKVLVPSLEFFFYCFLMPMETYILAISFLLSVGLFFL